jgi:capsular polysaccharide biosynthesis protein
MREGLGEGGAKELVRVWAQAHADLVLTALKERGTTSASRYAAYSSVDTRVSARAAARAMVAVVLVAMGVTGQSLLQQPTYAASAQVLVDQKPGDRLIPTMTHAIDSRPVAEEAIYRLGLRMEPAELLDNLTVEQFENTSFIVLSYEDTNPEIAQEIVNMVSKVSSELVPKASAAGSNVTATVYEEAVVPESPASPKPLRNGLLTLVIGLVLCVETALALPGVAAGVAGKLGRPAVPQGVGQAGLPFAPSVGPSEADVIKEKELLLALGRCEKLTAVEAALESSLSVEESERMLEALATKGHLEVSIEHGRLHYALMGEHDAPP